MPAVVRIKQKLHMMTRIYFQIVKHEKVIHIHNHIIYIKLFLLCLT